MSKKLRYTVTSVDFSDGEAGENAGTTHDVYQANLEFPKERKAREVAEMCDQCGEVFRKGQTREFRGIIYGVPCGCARDIPREILRDHAQDPPHKGGPEADSPILTE